MTRPINIYSISRIHDENVFSAVEKHHSQKGEEQRIQHHEIESLRILVDNMVRNGMEIKDFDGFFYGFCIPQIGKEFDLLKLSDKYIINVELKSTNVGKEQILAQLLKNRYYLNHLGKRLALYSIVTDEMQCYKLSLNNELVEVSLDDVMVSLKTVEDEYLTKIDNLFKASQYLVSPLNTPTKFILGEYFLTQAQEHIKNELLKHLDMAFSDASFHLTGKPGTGKTLLLYDIAKTLSKNGSTVIIHCGELADGQRKIGEEIENLEVISAWRLKNDDFDLSKYRFVLVDETHRIYENQFDKICVSLKENAQICVFSSDPEQVLSSAEKRRDIVGKIRNLNPQKEFVLSERIRTNKEISSFILNMKNLRHKPKVPMNYFNVQLNYANTTQEAQNILEYYRKKGFVFINYSKSNYETSPYAEYNEDFDTHHVIGQEFDKVVMLMDNSFYYDELGELQGVPHPNPDYLYPNLFYQGVTRVREELALIIVNAPELFEKITSIVK